MAKGGRKYRLLMYEYMLNRWWPMTLLVALSIFLNVGVLWATEWYFINPAENPLPVLPTVGGTVLLAVGGICLVFTFFVLFARKRAHVQCFGSYLQLSTPFLRLNISYKRIHKVTSAQYHHLFPLKSLSSWRRDLFEPVAGSQVVVIHLTAYPMPRMVVAAFLSPFFFYDKTPHFVLAVDDWMSFSTELDGFRLTGKAPQAPSARKPARAGRTSGLLDDLKRN